MISKMAKNEFEYGEVERGRTVLDTTLLTYPKRLDLWLLYANQLIKKREFEMAR
jgi:rRNA biogenesis protein RRP5